MRPLMPPVQTPDNLFHDGNPLTGELGTIVDAEHLNNEQAAIRDTQSELIAILTAAAMEPESTAGQLLAALNKLYAPLNDTLGALSSLVGGANKLPYFTSDNAAALTALSSIGRDIVGKATVADVLTYLGLGERLNNKLDKTGGILTGSLVVPELHAQNAIYIGDNDSGFHANGDGSVALWIDGKQVGYFTKNEFKHFGKIISMSGLAADDGNTQFQQDGDIKGKKWNGLLSTFMESRYGKKNTTGEGWWKCGDTGLMIQWGEVSSPNKVWFPTSFSWRCFSITFGQKNTAGWMTSPMADNIDKAGFSFYNNGRSPNDVNNQNVEDKVFYMAIGV
ncbi:gp53-like domain-containing protein [Serratia marcescens]|uniref:gp53-like domain-containing protein n=1 Tax=Serratia marcescens TaxID=615 RepID=UPI0027E4BA1E|nr:hypothetical protein [Serratia marcescens]